MTDLKTLPGRVSGFALVRGPDGKPKFDNIHNIPDQIWDMLTEHEQQDILNERDALSGNP